MIISALSIAGILFLIGLLVYGLCRAAARGDIDMPRAVLDVEVDPRHTGLFELVDDEADGLR